MAYLSALDASFIHMESNRTPMHVGGLMVFKLPKGAHPDYLSKRFQKLLKFPVTNKPFNYKLKKGHLAGVAPSWVVAKKIDIDYHVRHSALPYPGGEKELGVLVSRLHSNHLDFDRPLWEFHLIEGLENNRFAIYMKTHHAMIDGVGAMKMIHHFLTNEAALSNEIAPWCTDFQVKPERKQKSGNYFDKDTVKEALKHQVDAGVELVNKLRQMSDRKINPEGGLYSVMNTPKTLFNQSVSPQRRLATQLYNLERFKRIQKQTGATINDICLSVIGAATRRYLDELERLPEDSLVVSIPVGLPRPDDKVGNAAVGFTSPLGTDILDPLLRLENIKTITQRTKQQLKTLSWDALQQFSVLGVAPLMIGQLTGLGMKIPPMFNLVVSNVVASTDKLYWNDAELEAMYPISVLFDGYALNITVVGYADSLAVGFTGCRNALPSLQRLAVYTGDALKELEQALGIKSIDETNAGNSLDKDKIVLS
ncbi:MAG: wax ester/triacylglycerol synthase family O-acyltransferase [Gammaproteobacteria bacterium]|nr:MAG: wax ester/triacylglycerol synthase family O-acyltransferase [Gammaproteobacteria bacterium]